MPDNTQEDSAAEPPDPEKTELTQEELHRALPPEEASEKPVQEGRSLTSEEVHEVVDGINDTSEYPPDDPRNPGNPFYMDPKFAVPGLDIPRGDPFAEPNLPPGVVVKGMAPDGSLVAPAEVAKTLTALEARFKSKTYLHKGLKWERVRATLEDDNEALLSIIKMEKEGHEPNVYRFDQEGFDIGTCSKEVPENTRNCVYDETAAKYLESLDDPEIVFNGNAIAQAQEMGLELMLPDKYQKVLQEKAHGELDPIETSTCWLLTDEKTRKKDDKEGKAFWGNAKGGYSANISQDYAVIHSATRGWRGTRRILWA